MPSWAAQQEKLQLLAGCQLFFIGGAPRSGTTWLQYLLDSHPEVSCRGEGLFMKHLAAPLDALMQQRTSAITDKNKAVFRHADGYPLPAPDDAETLLGTAVLLALEHQRAGKPCRAVGEKTPENVFFFARLKRLFPAAKFIAIARDPRDLLTSAWHYFHKPAAGEDETAAKLAFLRLAFPSLDQGARTTLDLLRQFPDDCALVTYERLHAAPATEAARLFRFLGVSDAAALVEDCVARTSFAALSGGRAGSGAFYRKGVVGDWRSTLTPEMNEMVLRQLGWMFSEFGWKK